MGILPKHKVGQCLVRKRCLEILRKSHGNRRGEKVPLSPMHILDKTIPRIQDEIKQQKELPDRRDILDLKLKEEQ